MKPQKNLCRAVVVLAMLWSLTSCLKPLCPSMEQRSQCRTSTAGLVQPCNSLGETRPAINEQRVLGKSMHSAKYKYKFIEQRNCFCDQFCGFYDDCCADYCYKHAISLATSHFIKKATTCAIPDIGPLLMWSDDDPMETIPVYHVARCPATTTSGRLRNKCEGPINDSYEITRGVPVMGGEPLNIVFKNVFCAHCHGIHEVTWFNVRYKIAEILKPVNLSLEWCMSQDSTYCSVRLYSPATRRLAYCKKTVDVASNTAPPCSGSLLTNCREGPYDAVYGCRGKRLPEGYCSSGSVVYRNAACARCANAKSYSSCFEHYPGLVVQPVKTPIPSYSVLLDLSALTPPNLCLQHQVFIAGECRAIQEPTDIPKYNQTEPGLNCPKTVFISDDEFEQLTNETVIIAGDERVYRENEYHLQEKGLVLCADNYNQTPNQNLISFKFSKIQSWISIIGLILSMVGLLLQLIVYSMFSVLRNLPGKSLMCLSGSLLVAQLLFAISVRPSYGYELCVVSGVLMHYAFLTAFCWKNALAFQLCNTFCKSGQAVGRSQGGNKSFCRYSIYAWLLPALIVGISITVNFIDSVKPYFKPSYARGSSICWITRPGALIMFFAAPIAVLIILNAIFYGITIRNICVMQQGAKMAKGKTSLKRRLFLYTKLSLVFGLAWTFGFVATFSKLEPLWYLFIIFNTLQGVVIFVAFVCTKKVYKLLLSKITTSIISRNGASAHSTKTRTSTAGLDTSFMTMKASSTNNSVKENSYNDATTVHRR